MKEQMKIIMKIMTRKKPSIMEDYAHWSRVFQRANYIKTGEMIKQAEEDGWVW